MSTHRSGLAVGVSVFAASMMILVGFFHVVQGLVALVNDTFYVVGQEWVFSFDVTTWGWIHLVVGVVVVLAGIFILQGLVWARTVGVILAGASALLSFAWLPYYPGWALVVIAVDVLVIWALTAHGRDIAV
jgi:hypothetical protein